MCLELIPIWIRQNDAGPTRSRSTTMPDEPVNVKSEIVLQDAKKLSSKEIQEHWI